jgi:tRNA(His) guanylyltransferase
MSDTTSLGDRMKEYEAVWKTKLPRRLPLIIRVDGKSFHSYLRNAIKPFDQMFIRHMSQVAVSLCQEIQGAVFAYHQSDEISVLVQDYESIKTQAWFGKDLQKIVSISAAVASTALNGIREGGCSAQRALFDARAFVLPSDTEVANYFIWRQRDAVRNSISMAAQAQFSHKSLHGVSSKQMQEKLFQEKGINWNDYPTSCKRGQIVARTEDLEALTPLAWPDKEPMLRSITSTGWEIHGAPHFTADEYGWLAGMIPHLWHL